MGNYQHNSLTIVFHTEPNEKYLKVITAIVHALKLELPKSLQPYEDDRWVDFKMDELSDAFEDIGFSSRMNFDCHPEGCPEIFLQNNATDTTENWKRWSTLTDNNFGAYHIHLAFSSKNTSLVDELTSCIAQFVSEYTGITMTTRTDMTCDETTKMTNEAINRFMKLALNKPIT